MNRFRTVTGVLDREFAKPYVAGVSDCLFMGIAVIDALEGTDVARKYAKAYRTLAGSRRALRRRGYTDLTTMFAGELRREPQAPSAAQFGDIVVIRLADGVEHVGCCLGGRFVTKTENGRQYHGLPDVVSAFHIG